MVEVLDDDSMLEPEVLALCRWAATYYLSPLGEVLKTALPQGQRASSRRGVRLAPEGERLANELAAANPHASFATLLLDAQDKALLLRLRKSGSLG